MRMMQEASQDLLIHKYAPVPRDGSWPSSTKTSRVRGL
jgi:hypothetical protein